MISISFNCKVVVVCHRVEQSVGAHDAGFVPSESQLYMIKEECNMNGNLNSSNSTNSRRQKRNRNEKRFKCDVCSKMFTRKYHLKIHLRVHTGEKPFTCIVCSKGFSRNEYLALHKRTHTGEKPYKCDLCHTGFSRNDVLTKHARTHRIRSKPFLCGICQEAFSFKRALLRHKHIHRMEGRKVLERSVGSTDMLWGSRDWNAACRLSYVLKNWYLVQIWMKMWLKAGLFLSPFTASPQLIVVIHFRGFCVSWKPFTSSSA